MRAPSFASASTAPSYAASTSASTPDRSVSGITPSVKPPTPRRSVGMGSAGVHASVWGSRGSGPFSARKISAASSTERASGPGVASVEESGRTPYVLIRPAVTLRPARPHHAAGRRTEPPVSVPIATGARAAATATPDPLDDPPGVRYTARSHGFLGVPRCVLVPQL